ncbi:hypothetical protein Rhe02_37860 [Rhizocola hellebori]|uniref:Uncharacterized protein n=1 Tax=Rhizocola hellebori TaxID=1392758 RepID=A0A8J3Q941_9ACTN|nr:hypothetical protein [Rhizocola hellebori]GIH05719.1 hypothetical protein Rhe02_37860 [Rhizocola hellebori]
MRTLPAPRASSPNAGPFSNPTKAAIPNANMPPTPLTNNRDGSNAVHDSRPPAGLANAATSNKTIIANSTANRIPSSRALDVIRPTPNTATSNHATPAHTHHTPPARSAIVTPNKGNIEIWMQSYANSTTAPAAIPASGPNPCAT